MKKIIAFVTVCMLMLTMCTTSLAASFSDLNGSKWDWARDTIVELADKGIVKGYSDGTYLPSNSITNQEAFTLFARTIGVNDDINKDAVDAAQSLYADVAEKYNTYAVKELCYMLYRGIFTEDELGTYLSEATKDQPMKRHEAAILITKIMGGEKEVQNTVIYVFDYTDADEIPAASKGYIDFVRKKGIMQGMEDNTFSPNTSVTRAQVAIMLKKTMAVMNMSTASGTITSIDASSESFVVNSKTYTLSEETKINLDGKHASFDDLVVGQSVIITESVNGLWAVDAANGEFVNNAIEVIFTGTHTTSEGTFIKGFDRNLGASTVKEYLLAEKVSYTYEGKTSKLSDLKANDRLYITLSGGVVTAVEAEPKYRNVTDARIVEIILEPAPALKITHASSLYDQKTYEASTNVSVLKNSRKATLRDILPGDVVEMKLEYDTIISINASSKTSSTDGVIEEILIGQNNSSVKINDNGKTTSYAITRDTEIVVDGLAATIYDLRLGYSVDVKLESNAVTKITVRSIAQAKSVTGTVVLVNVSLGFINLEVIDASGNVTTQQVFVKKGASIIGSTSASRKTLSDIDVGDSLMITGEVKMGAFEANTVILLEN